VFLAAGILVIGGAAIQVRSMVAKAAKPETLHVSVSRSNLRISVTERGNLESQKTVDGICELRGYQNKIIFIVDEGTVVKKDDVVVRFDSAEIDKEIAQQEIQVNQARAKVETTRQEVEVQTNQAESNVAEAKLALTLAELDLEKYEKGDYLVELNDLKGRIALAEVEFEKARDEYDNFKILVKKGFREPEQLRVKEQTVASAEFNLKRDQEKLDVLEHYDYRRKLTEFKAKAEEARRKLDRAQGTANATITKAKSEHESAVSELKIVEQQLQDWRDEKLKCAIVAQQSGVLAYANEDWYDSDRRIREGAVVHRRQKIFSLPDMNLMQVKVNVHESVVRKVKAGQRAAIRVDAFPNDRLTGIVKSVSPLADSSNSWRSGGVKEYTTIVTIDELRGVPIKPGMTAEVEIRVDDLSNVVAVPVQAVTEHRHQHFVYAHRAGHYERIPVQVGQSNNRMVEITSGLTEGEPIALDARARGVAEFQDDDDVDNEAPESPREEKPAAAVARESSAEEPAVATTPPEANTETASAVDQAG
jgi:RND family efflux transporter MFP subunit